MLAKMVLDYIRGRYDGGRGASQSEIAREVHLSQSYVNKLISGKVSTGDIRISTFLKMFPHAVVYLDGKAPEASASTTSPEVAAVLNSDRPLEEKAALIKLLCGGGQSAPPSPPPAEQSTRIRIRWHDAVQCPKCGEDILFPADAKKVTCPKCGQHLAFAKPTQNEEVPK